MNLILKLFLRKREAGHVTFPSRQSEFLNNPTTRLNFISQTGERKKLPWKYYEGETYVKASASRPIWLYFLQIAFLFTFIQIFLVHFFRRLFLARFLQMASSRYDFLTFFFERLNFLSQEFFSVIFYEDLWLRWLRSTLRVNNYGTQCCMLLF